MLKPRHIRFVTICACGLFTIAGFQNFSIVSLESLKLARLETGESTARAADDSGASDIRTWAPHRPPGFSNDLESDKQILAIPQSGNNLESISQDWALRQTHLLTDGADERFLKDINQKVNHLFDGDDERAPASESAGGAPEKSVVSPAETEPGAFSGFRFSALNKIEMKAPGQTNLSCSAAGAALLVNLSKPISNRMDVSLQHQTSSGGTSTLRLHYNW